MIIFIDFGCFYHFAGKIRSIRIREQGVPFKVVMENNGYAKLVATEELDAEMMSEYRFSIFAVDNGTRARKSERSRVYCDVIDVNEFAPIFRHPTYEAEIQRGMTYGKIIQVRLHEFWIQFSFAAQLCKTYG